MTPAGLHHIHLEAPLSWPDGETKENLMQRIVHRFEEFIREQPDQWYAFRRMFKRNAEIPPQRSATAPERG
jgi:lauroyl/myristoyl acyltransferase